ncbi:hypothetical protein O1611_g1063 [Lasiodiplodia mahajangana]|uniref:Uncharacterized protein n=1 Tax=Lasiodiplodia mahajangana TaxID=1108764 RepID=A0ACC2JYK3_9PEZI|nr:hypothetical protein O1611_g1063 [Lasiodiplodia mahajangana]
MIDVSGQQRCLSDDFTNQELQGVNPGKRRTLIRFGDLERQEHLIAAVIVRPTSSDTYRCVVLASALERTGTAIAPRMSGQTHRDKTGRSMLRLSVCSFSTYKATGKDVLSGLRFLYGSYTSSAPLTQPPTPQHRF